MFNYYLMALYAFVGAVVLLRIMMFVSDCNVKRLKRKNRKKDKERIAFKKSVSRAITEGFVEPKENPENENILLDIKSLDNMHLQRVLCFVVEHRFRMDYCLDGQGLLHVTSESSSLNLHKRFNEFRSSLYEDKKMKFEAKSWTGI